MANQRYRLICDNDGHYYVIPADKEAQFEEWVGHEESGGIDDRYSGPYFSECRINGSYGLVTFTDPRDGDRKFIPV